MQEQVRTLSHRLSCACAPSSYLERDFPLERLYELSKREGNSKRPIYQIHKWWARRLGSVFRTLILTMFMNQSESEREFWQKFYNGTSFNGKIIYDPFFGGGTTVVEGLRLGCKVIGQDINPVAWFITKKEIEPLDPEKADNCFRQVEREASSEIGRFYETRCPNGHRAKIMYTLWIQEIRCRHCGRKAKLFRDHIISERNERRHVICPVCLSISTKDMRTKKTHCQRCNTWFAIEEGVVSKGVFTCPNCRTGEHLRQAAERCGSHLPSKMLCIHYYCEKCGQGYKSPTDFDERLFKRASEIWKSAKDRSLYPKQLISTKGKKSARPVNFGYRYFYQLFNERQLLCLSLLLKAIARVGDQSIREFLLLSFSNALETNNRLCKYESKWNKISALFGVPDYHVVERCGENNVWGTTYGRGTFTKCYRKLRRAKAYVANTYEISYQEHGHRKRIKIGEKVETNLAYSYDSLVRGPYMVMLRCQDSARADHIPDKSVDAVITDPPYYDNITYAALADFFYVWLRILLKDTHESFEKKSSARNGDIIVNSDYDIFVEKLTRVFSECNRILKDNGLLVFTFHHTSTRAWKGIRKVLRDSGFVVTAVPVVRSEGRTGYRKTGSISHDLCIVCRKGPQVNLGETYNLSQVLERSIELVRRLQKLNGELSDSDIFSILMGQGLRLDDQTYEQIAENHLIYVQAIKANVSCA